jgi:hypothetical protein
MSELDSNIRWYAARRECSASVQLLSVHPRNELPDGIAYDATAAAVIQPMEAVGGVTIRSLGSRTMISWPAHSACSQALAFVLARKIRRRNDGKMEYSMVLGTLLERVLAGVLRLGGYGFWGTKMMRGRVVQRVLAGMQGRAVRWASPGRMVVQ